MENAHIDKAENPVFFSPMKKYYITNPVIEEKNNGCLELRSIQSSRQISVDQLSENCNNVSVGIGLGNPVLDFLALES